MIAQVKRLAASGSIAARNVSVPGPLVDCVVVVDDEDHEKYHSMSYMEKHNSAFTGEIRTPQQSVKPIPMSLRKIIARRAFLALRPNKVRVTLANASAPFGNYLLTNFKSRL